jgi:hypothetical protein
MARSVEDAPVRRFHHQADSENRSFGLIQKLHLPFGVLLEFSGNAADDPGTNAGQLFPGGMVIGKFGALIARAGEAAVADPKKIERHGMTRCVKAAPGL